VFAPGTGRFLLPSLGAIVVAAVLELLGVLPRSLVSVGVLVIAVSYWAFFAAFFRDPDRVPGPGVVSPADGKVLGIERSEGRVRIAVFMNVTDVHVNRFPLDARIEAIETSGEGFRPAYLPDARHNLQRRYLLESALGPVEVIQMTGIVARRLVSFVGVGATGQKGERLGMIVLGSRVDLLLPADRVRVTVAVGDVVRAGSTTLARERSS
jgi:phosphatidylserine decarboxylase